VGACARPATREGQGPAPTRCQRQNISHYDDRRDFSPSLVVKVVGCSVDVYGWLIFLELKVK